MKKILLIGTHGQSNWGDDILLETFLTQLGNQNTYFVNSYDPHATEKLLKPAFNITCFHTTHDILKLTKYLFECDFVFFAGGTILRELYKDSNRNRYSSLAMVALLTFGARYIARKRIIMSNIGVGPLPSALGKRIARFALHTTMLASFRDQQSMQLALACGIKTALNTRVVPDCVFVNDRSYFVLEKEDSARKTGNIGLNLVYGVAKPELRERYLNALLGSISHAVHETQAKIIPIPMQIAYNKRTDTLEIQSFMERMGTKIEIIPPRSPQELGHLFLSCEYIIGARYHAVVISAILGIPIIPLLYDIKVASLMERLELEDYSVPIDTEVSTKDITKRINRLLQNHNSISERLKSISSRYKNELDDYFNEVRSIIAAK